MTVLTFINRPSQKGQESGTAINVTKTKAKPMQNSFIKPLYISMG